jgi:hypothetical protein
MPLVTGDRHTHHHGLLAGLGAGTAAVLACAVFVLGVWHRVSGTVADAVTVIVWALVAAVLAAAAYVLWYLFLRARNHLTHPETLTRHAVRAEVVPPPLPVADLPAAVPVAELPAGGTHYHFDSPEAVETALRAMQERPGTGSHHDPA